MMADQAVQIRYSDKTYEFADQAVSQENRVARVQLHLPSLSEYPINLEWELQVIPGKREKVLLGADLLRHLGMMTDHGIQVIMPSIKDNDQAVNLPEHRYIDAIDAAPEGNPVDRVHIAEDFQKRDKLRECLQKHADVFSDELHPDGALLPAATINLRPDAPLPHAKPRPVRPDWKEEIHQQIEDLQA